MNNTDQHVKLLHSFGIDDIPWDYGKELFTYWQAIKGERSMPSRLDFKPMDVPHLLPNIYLVNIEAATPDKMKNMVIGSKLVEVYGMDATGEYLNTSKGSKAGIERILWLKNNKKPYLAINCPAFFASKDFLKYTVLGLPLSKDDDKVHMMLSIISFSK